ncbi:MAG: hypothetical protein HYT03_00295 [Candidatus Harrisonbacteria bacterium]|nr:hypothetical protein [Candidatus Harrisonbacteria bacterium]
MIKIFLTLGIFVALVVNAQVAPELMVTWKANSYAPSAYQGKILPSNGSKIDVAVELIDRGSLANLTNVEIRWYVDGQFRESGNGLKNFSFNANQVLGDQEIRVMIPSYRGVELRKTIIIPLAAPEVIIESPYPSNAVSALMTTFRALPYFFNFPNLNQASFSWAANGISSRGTVADPDLLNLNLEDLPSGANVNLEVTVSNLLKPIEFITKSILLTIQ